MSLPIDEFAVDDIDSVVSGLPLIATNSNAPPSSSHSDAVLIGDGFISAETRQR